MTNAQALGLLMEFKKSIECVTAKQDELLTELASIKALLLALLNGGVDIGEGRNAQELCEQLQQMIEKKVEDINPEFRRAAQSAEDALTAFSAGMDGHCQPYS